jgi:hypothetical protein
VIAKSLDIVVLLKLLLERQQRSYADLSKDLYISASEIHAAAMRSIAAGLLGHDRVPLRKPLENYLLHGVRYAFPAQRGAVARGMPTAFAAPPLSKEVASNDLPLIWVYPEGTVRGVSIPPLYKTVPKAAKADPALYELLALVDALRIGRARERKLAEDELHQRLNHAYAT